MSLASKNYPMKTKTKIHRRFGPRHPTVRHLLRWCMYYHSWNDLAAMLNGQMKVPRNEPLLKERVSFWVRG